VQRPVITTAAGLLILVFLGPVRAEERHHFPVKLELQDTGTSTIQILATNGNPCAMHVDVRFLVAENVEDLPAEAWRTVVPAQAVDVPILTLTRRMDRGYRCQYRYHAYPKAPPAGAREADFAYWLPYEHETKYRVIQGYMGGFSHKDKYALDFEMPVGTIITAARAGVVVNTKADSSRGGPDSSLLDEANYVEILHDDGTLARYVHLDHNGVLVKKGEAVRPGQAIGKSGQTGFTDMPHLHFEVLSMQDGRIWESRPTSFVGPTGPLHPVAGQDYVACHPRRP
jgi:murein DD-endopeptidase MepM/ murein hydrolase activator NlpD